MQRLGRLMVTLNVLATLALWVAAALGYRGVDDVAELRVHVLAGLAPLLLFVLSHLWCLFYLLGASRVLGRMARAEGTELDPAMTSFRSRTMPPILVALALGTGCFVLGTGAYGGWVSGWIHGTAFYLTVVTEGWAAWSEWRAFGAAERSVERLEAAA